MLCTRTLPLSKRSATVATVSLVLFVHELTARIKSPRESLERGLRIRVFFFINNVVLTAIRVPSFNVNKPSVVEARLLAACWFVPWPVN